MNAFLMWVSIGNASGLSREKSAMQSAILGPMP